MRPPLARRCIAVEFVQVRIALQVNDPPAEQKRKEINRSCLNLLRGRLMRREFPPDSVGRAADPVVAGKGKPDRAGRGGWIVLFTACQRKLFHKDSCSTDTG